MPAAVCSLARARCVQARYNDGDSVDRLWRLISFALLSRVAVTLADGRNRLRTGQLHSGRRLRWRAVQRHVYASGASRW